MGPLVWDERDLGWCRVGWGGGPMLCDRLRLWRERGREVEEAGCVWDAVLGTWVRPLSASVAILHPKGLVNGIAVIGESDAQVANYISRSFR